LAAVSGGSAAGVFFELLLAGGMGKNMSKAFRQKTLSGSNLNTGYPILHAPENVARTAVSRLHEFIPLQLERLSL
jgi:hypothetical protein